jgi:hypothetical protein
MGSELQGGLSVSDSEGPVFTEVNGTLTTTILAGDGLMVLRPSVFQAELSHSQRPCRGVKSGDGMVAPMAYSRQWLVDTLRRLGFSQEADEALRVLPEEIDREQLLEFADRHGMDRGTLTDRMGGSP